MKTGLSLQDLSTRIQAVAESSRDFLLSAKALTTVAMPTELGGGISAVFGSSTKGGLEEGHMLGVTPTAHHQISEYCDIPAAYYRRCLTEAPQLLSENLNHWLAAQGDHKRLVRTAEGKVRALLSDRYRPLDNFDLAKHVLPIIGEAGLRVESANLTETRLYLKCVNEKVSTEISRGDVVQAGVIISNSEVGEGSLSVQPLVYRLVCKNGLISQDQTMRKHHTGDRRKSGSNLSSAMEVYCDDTLKAMDHALWLQVADMTKSAISDALFTQIVDKMRDAKGGTTISDPVKALEVTRKRFDLTETESTDILKHLAMGGDLSRFGLLNAVTRAAQDVESYDRATELEKLGGQILDLAEKEWTVIAG